MHINNWKKEILTIPNLLSMTRILVIPVYSRIYLTARTPEAHSLAAGLIALSCLTDAADGWIARRFQMITNLGKILDPLADKATQFSLIYCVCRKNPHLSRLLYPLALLFAVKESIQLAALMISCRRRLVLPGALLPGKVSTCVLFISMILMVLLPDLPEGLLCAMVVTDGCFLAFSLASYMLTYCVRQETLRPLRSENE